MVAMEVEDVGLRFAKQSHCVTSVSHDSFQDQLHRTVGFKCTHSVSPYCICAFAAAGMIAGLKAMKVRICF
jgi:hypothetical protein